MIVYPVLNSLLLKVSNPGVLLEEEPVPEIHLFNFTDWGWVVFFIVVTLVIWGLIVFQSISKLIAFPPYKFDLRDPKKYPLKKSRLTEE